VIWDTEKGQVFSLRLFCKTFPRVIKIRHLFNNHRIPVCTLFNPRGNEDMTTARISPDANHVVTVSNGKCQNVYFWLWTHGKDKPDGSLL